MSFTVVFQNRLCIELENLSFIYFFFSFYKQIKNSKVVVTN